MYATGETTSIILHTTNNGAMSVHNLSARLGPLFDVHKQTVHLIQRLSKLPAGPGASSLDPEAGDARLDLSTEIHQSLKEQEEEFELLRQEVEDLTNTTGWASAARRRDSEIERERTDLAAQVARLGEDLKLCVCPSPLKVVEADIMPMKERAPSSERHNCRLNAMLKLPDGKNESFSSPESKKVIPRPGKAVGKVRNSSPRTKWS